MILITGGAGYIGSHVNKLLNQKGYKTVVFDNLSRGHMESVKWGDFFFGDLSDSKSVRMCLEQYHVDSVMHFSSFAYVGESIIAPEKYYKNNVANTLNLLEIMKDFRIGHFVFSSSCATYGIPGEIPITERHEQRPINPYGRTKLIIEEMLKDFESAYGIRHVNLRYFNAAGADPENEIGERHIPETHLIPLTIQAALGQTDCVKVFGTDYPTRDGTCIRDYIHVTDLAEAHIRALEHLKGNGKSDSFNLGTGSGYSVREIIAEVRKTTKNNFKVVDESRREGDPPVLLSSSQKAGGELGWNPAYSDISTIIETALRWMSR